METLTKTTRNLNYKCRKIWTRVVTCSCPKMFILSIVKSRSCTASRVGYFCHVPQSSMHTARRKKGNFWLQIAPLPFYGVRCYEVRTSANLTTFHLERNIFDVLCHSQFHFINCLWRSARCRDTDHGSRAVWGMNCLRSLGCCNRRFESYWGMDVCVRLFCLC
jgi:hypothetical protein